MRLVRASRSRTAGEPAQPGFASRPLAQRAGALYAAALAQAQLRDLPKAQALATQLALAAAAVGGRLATRALGQRVGCPHGAAGAIGVDGAAVGTDAAAHLRLDGHRHCRRAGEQCGKQEPGRRARHRRSLAGDADADQPAPHRVQPRRASTVCVGRARLSV